MKWLVNIVKNDIETEVSYRSPQVVDLIVNALLGRPTSVSSVLPLHLSRNRYCVEGEK
jgi:hypothetical protein